MVVKRVCTKYDEEIEIEATKMWQTDTTESYSNESDLIINSFSSWMLYIGAMLIFLLSVT